MVIRDTIALGSFAGVVGTIPALIWNYVSVQLNFGRFYAFQLPASVYLFPGLTDSFQGLTLGGIVWMMFAAALGILTAYLLRWTGTDYWWLKGLVVSQGVMFIIIYGFVYTFGGARIVPFDFATNFSVLIGNVIFGLVTPYLIVRLSPIPSA